MLFDRIALEISLAIYYDNAIYTKMRDVLTYDHKGIGKLNLSGKKRSYYENNVKHFNKLKTAYEIRGDEEKLSKIWKDAVVNAISIYQEPDKLDLADVMVVSYCLLDLHGDYREKLKKKITFDNIYRDGKNIWYASQAKYFITEDEATRKKAKFIYKAFKKDVKVWSMEEFCHNMYI